MQAKFTPTFALKLLMGLCENFKSHFKDLLKPIGNRICAQESEIPRLKKLKQVDVTTRMKKSHFDSQTIIYSKWVYAQIYETRLCGNNGIISVFQYIFATFIYLFEELEMSSL